MDTKKIKNDVGVLIIGMLDHIGLLRNGEIITGVEIFSTTDAYIKSNKDVMVVASVNSEGGNGHPPCQFVLIGNGLILNRADTKKLGKEAEISQLYIDKTKAALLLSAILHAFPELSLTPLEKNKQKNLFPEPVNTIKDDPTQKILKSLPDVYETSNFNLSEATTVDESIGYLKKKIYELEELKSRGFEKVICQYPNSLSFSKEKVSEPLDSDLAINVHLKNKEWASQFDGVPGEVITHNQKDKTFYISWVEDKGLLKIVEADVSQQIRQKLVDLPQEKTTKSILVDAGLAKKLQDVISKLK